MKGEKMEERQAIIEKETGKIKCPVCKKTNGIITPGAYVRGHRIRCKSSRRGHEHFFILNYGQGKEGEEND